MACWETDETQRMAGMTRAQQTPSETGHSVRCLGSCDGRKLEGRATRSSSSPQRARRRAEALRTCENKTDELAGGTELGWN